MVTIERQTEPQTSVYGRIKRLPLYLAGITGTKHGCSCDGGVEKALF